jgi:hypothetical protein
MIKGFKCIISGMISILLAACASGNNNSVDFVPEKKFYKIVQEESYQLPKLAVKRNKNNMGALYIQKVSNEPNEFMRVDITRKRSKYKASTPLFFDSNNKKGRFALSVERGRNLMAGLEFSFSFNWQ